jgi:hypothetical protein
MVLEFTQLHMPLVKVSGQWKQVANAYVKTNSVWKEINMIYTKVSGTWKNIVSIGEIPVVDQSPGSNWSAGGTRSYT